MTQLLLAPKPTTFQHYLEQPDGVRTKMADLRHWGDDDTPVRGHKLYWHRVTSDDMNALYSWVLPPNAPQRNRDDERGSGTEQSPVRALRPGAEFTGKIRFENLTKAEIGALLFVLELPENCRHKVGLGKPLGLGTVSIRATLTLIDRKERYARLWDSEGAEWNHAERTEKDHDAFKDAFAKPIGKAVGHAVANWRDLWKHDRLAAMEEMLRFDEGKHGSAGWLEATRYMEIQHPKFNNEYRDRPVLPGPEEV